MVVRPVWAESIRPADTYPVDYGGTEMLLDRNGTDREHVDLVVFAGQSNMSGRGTVAEAILCNSLAGYEYKAVSRPGELLPVREPFGLGEDREGAIWDYDSEGCSKRAGSMVSAVIDTYYSLSGRRIVGVSASVGGSDTVQWKELYLADAIDRLEKAKGFLLESHYGIDKIFIVWCQGESDGDAGRTVEEYTANTREIIGVFQAHGVERCFLVQTGHYNYVEYPGTVNGLTGREWDQRYGTIRMAQEALCRQDHGFVLAASLAPYIHEMKDQYHYNQKAYNLAGRAVGTAMADYVNAG